jgi:hypothetical protein
VASEANVESALFGAAGLDTIVGLAGTVGSEVAVGARDGVAARVDVAVGAKVDVAALPQAARKTKAAYPGANHFQQNIFRLRNNVSLPLLYRFDVFDDVVDLLFGQSLAKRRRPDAGNEIFDDGRVRVHYGLRQKCFVHRNGAASVEGLCFAKQ